MAKMPEIIEPEVDEAEKIIHEYRQGISQAIEKVRAKLREHAEQESNQIIIRAEEKSASIIARAQQEAELVIAEAKKQADKDVERIITEAKQKAEQFVNSTEKRLKTEGKEKARKQVERIIKEAKDEAAELKQKAEREVEEVKKKAHEEAERIINNAEETARKDREGELVRIITEAKQMAEQIVSEARAQAESEREQMVANVASDAMSKAKSEAAQILDEARQKAEKIIIQAKSMMWTDLEKSSLLVKGAQQRLGKVIEAAESEIISAPINLEDKEDKFELSPAAENEHETGTMPVEKDDEEVYNGRLELHLVPPIDRKQMDMIEKPLLRLPNLRLIGRGGSSDGMTWVKIELGEPLPILKILKQMLPVKEAVAYGNNIVISLNARQTVYDN